MTCPCGICEIRHVGCHSACDAYNAWQAEKAEQKRKRDEARNRASLIHDYVAETGAALNRRHGRKRK